MNKLLLLLLFIYTSSFSQEPLVIDLNKDSRIIEIINLKEKGVFFITGKDISLIDGKAKIKPGDLDTRLKYVSPDLKLIWNKSFPLEPDNLIENYYVACSDSFIYFVEVLAGGLTKSNYLITQIDYSGVTRIFEYNVPFKIDKIHDLYCDKDYFYIFYDEFKDSKKPYHFIGLSHSNFQVTPVDIAFPKLPKKKETLGYERRIFTGIHQDLFYFYSKLAESSNSCNYTFTLINKKGETQSSFILDGSLEKNLYIAPTNNPHINQSWTDSEFNFISSGEGIYPAIGSLGDIFTDFDNECMYLFGNYHTEPFNNTGSNGKVSGAFINKFDLKGNVIWKKNFPFPKEMKDPLLRSSSYSDRSLFFSIDPRSENITLDISFLNTKKKHSIIFNKSGEFVKYNMAEFATIPEVGRGIMRISQASKGDATPVFRKPNRYVEEVDTKGMQKMEELSKSSKKVLGSKLKNPGFAPYPNLYYLVQSKKEEILIESNFGEGTIKLYLFPY